MVTEYYRREWSHLSYIERKRKASLANTSMRLNRLERPEPWPGELLTVLRNAVVDVQQYPDYHGIYRKLSDFFGVPERCFVLGLGSEEFIRSIMLLACGERDRRPALVLAPTFAMYGVHAAALNISLIEIPASLPLSSERMVAGWLQRDFAVLFIPNPGQPIETHFAVEELSVIADACEQRGALLVVDEAYFGFGSATALELAMTRTNVIVLRTFSKGWGLAGLRIGAALGHETLIAPLHAIRLSGEIAGPSMQMLSVMIDHYDSHVRPSMEAIALERDALRECLIGMGLKSYGSLGNHVRVELDAGHAGRVGRWLSDRGIEVNYTLPPPVSDSIMITIGGAAIMSRFVEALHEALSPAR